MALTTDSVGGKGDKADHGANPSTTKDANAKDGKDAAAQSGTRSSGKASGAAGSDAKDESGDQASNDHRNVDREDHEDMPEKVVAAATSDPEVHKILADQDIAWQNGDAQGVHDANTRLNELGYK